jgi:hypothetical protein
VKFFTTLLLALLAGLVIYAARRRLKLAFTTAAIAYMVLLPIRFLFASRDAADRLENLVLPTIAAMALWLVLWRVSTLYERRKR